MPGIIHQIDLSSFRQAQNAKQPAISATAAPIYITNDNMLKANHEFVRFTRREIMLKSNDSLDVLDYY